MQNISHIIWDWNGTLLDDTQACVNSVNKMLGDRKLPLLSVERYRDLFGFPVSDFYDKIGFVLEDEDWDAMAVEFHDLFLSDSTVCLQPDARETLDLIGDMGVLQSILSASKHSILDTMIENYQLKHNFKFVRGINNLYGDSKISMGRALIEDIDLPCESIVVIGDSLHDYEVAQDLGVGCMLVACGHQSYARLSCAGVPVFHSLAEVAGLFRA